MIIAIDLDETLFSCNSVIYRILNKLQKPSAINTKLKYKQVEKQKNVNAGLLRFFSRMFNPDKYKPLNEAVNCINALYNEGNQIIFLSSRPHFLKNLRNSALIWLEKNNVRYDTLIFGCRNKAAFCKTFNVDMLIDDKLENCRNVNAVGTHAINICSDKNFFKNNPSLKNSDPLLFTSATWSSVYLLSQMIKYKRGKYPLDFNRLNSDISSRIFDFKNTISREDLANFLFAIGIGSNLVDVKDIDNKHEDDPTQMAKYMAKQKIASYMYFNESAPRILDPKYLLPKPPEKK